MSLGYVTCAHAHCFATFIGAPGDLCDDCRECNDDPDALECNGCDNDSGEDGSP